MKERWSTAEFIVKLSPGYYAPTPAIRVRETSATYAPANTSRSTHARSNVGLIGKSDDLVFKLYKDMTEGDKSTSKRAYFDLGYLAEVDLKEVHCACGVL